MNTPQDVIDQNFKLYEQYKQAFPKDCTCFVGMVNGLTVAIDNKQNFYSNGLSFYVDENPNCKFHGTGELLQTD